jgi:hypothetical protein
MHFFIHPSVIIMYSLLHPSIHHHPGPELPSSRAELIPGPGGLNVIDVVKIIPGPVGLNAGPRHSASVKIKVGPGGLNARRENRTGPGMDNFTTHVCDGACRYLLVQDAEFRQG